MLKLARATLMLLALTVLASPLEAAQSQASSRNSSGQGQSTAEFCMDLAESGDIPWLSVGECVALNLSSDAEAHNFWVHRCDNWRDEGLLELVGYGSYSECVRDH
jgi:hypothetical protein